MTIDYLQYSDITRLYDFFSLIHPEKTPVEIKSYLDHWLAKVPNSMDYVVTQKEGDEIVGQNFFSPMSFFLNGEKKDSFWGFDLYVKEEYRKQNYGAYLLLEERKRFSNDFATGSGPDAMALIGKLGGKKIGEIRKYVGIINPISSISSICRGFVPINKFPKNVCVDGKQFFKITAAELPEIATPYNQDILEINHDVDFLKWKFFESYREYAFYLNKETNDYIVMRTIIKKHVTMLMVTDYRCSLSCEKDVEALYQVVKKVANSIKVAFVFWGSSVSAVDTMLEKHSFKAIGRHRPIITYEKECKKPECNNAITKRHFALVTLADSDGEPI